MRLSNRIRDMIKQSILESFGEVDVYLFGSRVDNTKKGGDIDIAVDTNIAHEEFKRKKIKFLSQLLRLGFDMKIDVVSFNTTDSILLQEIRNNHCKL